MKRPPEPLDPSQFTIVPHVAIVDEFVMTNDDGSFKAEINESWIDKNVAHMNEREAATGDLCPYVIGHTPDEHFAESDPTVSPPLIGYLRNWHKDDLFETGRKASFADLWLFKGEEERAKRFPRRSAEIYVDLYEVDPCSALGPTTPARDLGLLKLSRNTAGSLKLSRDCPDQRCEMPENKVADPKETGTAKAEDAKLDQVLSLLTQLVDKLTGGGAAQPAPAAAVLDAPADASAGNPGDELSDEELMKLLGEEGDQPEPTDKKKNEPKEKESRDTDAVVALQRENDELKVKLARTEVETALLTLKDEGYAVDPKDAALITDLIAQPADMRTRSIDRLKLSGRSGVVMNRGGGWLEQAIPNAVEGKKFLTTKEEQAAVMKLARQKGITFGQAARDMGYTTAE